MRRLFRTLIKQRGDQKWDITVRATGAAALAGIPVVVLFPALVPLVWLVLVGIPANGPLSPILPTAFEPLMMEAVKYQPVLRVTLVALAVYMYMEFLNWHIYGWVLNLDSLEFLHEKRWIRWSVRQFARSPTGAVLFFAATPVPFWIIRILAIMHSYPLPRFMVATAVGRFPRLYLYAWLGAAISIPTVLLVSVAFGTGVLVVGWRLLRGRAVLEDIPLRSKAGTSDTV